MKGWDFVLQYPWLALVPATVFLLACLARFRAIPGTGRRVVAALPVAAWAVYAVYEWRMQLWSTTVVAPIRIDLLILIPALLLVSIVGLVALVYR